MPIVIICQNKDPLPWVKALNRVAPDVEIRLWPDDQDRDLATMALTWSHPPGVLAHYPNLRLISSMGAGIDHINNDSSFPSDVPVTRIIDPELLHDMYDYLETQIAGFRHHSHYYGLSQQTRQWLPLNSIAKDSVRVGVMGLGKLGGHVAVKLAQAGYSVLGWARSQKALKGVHCFSGQGNIKEFLRQSNVLINLLPLTKSTQAILNRQYLSCLPQQAYLINVGRGLHLVERDLIELLDEGHLSGACLDVFQQEPLPEKHPFWSHPKIKITPHVSSLTNPESVASQVVLNYRRIGSGEVFDNQVDLQRGY